MLHTLRSALVALCLIATTQALQGQHPNPIHLEVSITGNATAQGEFPWPFNLATSIKSDWFYSDTNQSFWLSDIAMLFDKSEVRHLSVERYSARQFPSPTLLNKMLLRVWNTKVGQPTQWINWAEGSFWSVECKIELENGKFATLITDRGHFCYQNAEGYRWFFK